MDVARIQLDLEKFAEERDWNQFHSPKNLVMALSVEASELLEHFQWLTPEQSAALDKATIGVISSEIADVQMYLLRLADKLGIDIETAVDAKIQENRRIGVRVKGQSKPTPKLSLLPLFTLSLYSVPLL